MKITIKIITTKEVCIVNNDRNQKIDKAWEIHKHIQELEDDLCLLSDEKDDMISVINQHKKSFKKIALRNIKQTQKIIDSYNKHKTVDNKHEKLISDAKKYSREYLIQLEKKYFVSVNPLITMLKKIDNKLSSIEQEIATLKKEEKGLIESFDSDSSIQEQEPQQDSSKNPTTELLTTDVILTKCDSLLDKKQDDKKYSKSVFFKVILKKKKEFYEKKSEESNNNNSSVSIQQEDEKKQQQTSSSSKIT